MIYDYWMEHGLGNLLRPEVQLYDLIFDPNDVHNLAGDTEYARPLNNYCKALEQWMMETNDPAHINRLPLPPLG